jgi:carbonic anhydrase
MKFAILSALVVSGAKAAAGSVFDYRKNGSDWPSAFPTCGGKNQSPINLSTSPNAGYRQYDAAEDNFIKNYSN